MKDFVFLPLLVLIMLSGGVCWWFFGIPGLFVVWAVCFIFLMFFWTGLGHDRSMDGFIITMTLPVIIYSFVGILSLACRFMPHP